MFRQWLKSKKAPGQSYNTDPPKYTPEACYTSDCSPHNHTMPAPQSSPAPTSFATPAASETRSPAPPVATEADSSSPILPPPPFASLPASIPLNERITGILNGAPATLNVAATNGTLPPVPWVKNVATVTKSLIGLIQTVHQNDEQLQELLQRAIALGQCMIDVVDAYHKNSEDGLPDYFSQHLALLHDTLKNVDAMWYDLLKAGKVGKTWNIEPNQAKIEEYKRSLQGGLDFFSLRSNIAMEAHFLKLTQLIEKRYPLGGYIEKVEPVPQTSEPDMTFSPSLSNTFTYGPGTFHCGNGVQTNITGQSGRAGDTYYQLPPVVGVPYAGPGFPYNSQTFTCNGGIQSGLGNQTLTYISRTGPSFVRSSGVHMYHGGTSDSDADGGD